MSDQLGLPVPVPLDAIERKKTLGHAMELCAELAGFEFDKQLQTRLDVDKAQFSRWQSGAEGIVWPKFVRLMDLCGNDAPLLWMNHQRGWDLASMRRRESETERDLRIAREEIERLKVERRVLVDALNGRTA